MSFFIYKLLSLIASIYIELLDFSKPFLGFLFKVKANNRFSQNQSVSSNRLTNAFYYFLNGLFDRIIVLFFRLSILIFAGLTLIFGMPTKMNELLFYELK